MGDDVYVVDSTNQYILERANEGVDTVKSSVTFSLVAGARTGGARCPSAWKTSP